MARLAKADVDRIVASIRWRCRSWGDLERAAGITDREAFWRDKTEDQARAECVALIAEREVAKCSTTTVFEEAKTND